MITMGDYRQLADALFKAGTGSGSSYEYTDTLNRLRFYVLNLKRDGQGILSYTVGIQSLDGNGTQQRDVDLESKGDATSAADAVGTTCVFSLTNTGDALAAGAYGHPEGGDLSAYLNNDVYRLSLE